MDFDRTLHFKVLKSNGTLRLSIVLIITIIYWSMCEINLWITTMHDKYALLARFSLLIFSPKAAQYTTKDTKALLSLYAKLI
jgi:hypothetical protein